jgi:hypothetical protein
LNPRLPCHGGLLGEITINKEKLNRQYLGWNGERVKPCFLILKRAESVFRENPKIKQRILSATGK